MEFLHLAAFGMCMIALTGGCADILGADFDRHPRSRNGLDGALDSDASQQDGGDSTTTKPLTADATSEAPPMTGDSPARDAGASSDVADVGNRFDAHDAIDAGPLRDGSDVEDDRHTTDPADAAEGGHPHDGGEIDVAGDARGGGNPDDGGDARGGGNPDDAGERRDGGNRDDVAYPNDGGDATGGGDVVDAGGPAPPPDAPRTTGVIGGFVTLGAPNRGSSTIELRGHIISNAAVRGVTSTGISIEGKIQ